MSRSILGLIALPFVFSPLVARAQVAAPSAATPPTAAPPVVAPLPTSTSTETEVALEELIRRAQANSPLPQIAANNLEAARARAGAASARLNPTLQIVPGLGGNTNSRNEEVILSQSLDLLGQRRANRTVFEAQVRRAQAEQTLAGRSLVVQVKNAAADLFAAQEAESLGVAQVSIARQFRDAAARKAQFGDAPPVQTQRAQLELDRAEVELDQTRAERLSRRATLNQLIGAAPETPLRVALPDVGFLSFSGLQGTPSSTLGLPSAGLAGAGASFGVPSVSPGANPPGVPAAPDLGAVPQTPIVGASSQVGSELVASRASLLPGALQRPDILAAQFGVEEARAQVEAIGRARRPLIEVQVRRAGVTDPSPLSLRAVITVPLLDFGSIKRQQSAARFEVAAQEGQVAFLRSQAAAQIESALVRLNANRRTVQRYRTSLVPQTLDLLRKTQVGYAAGASTYLEVLEAQRAARQIQTEYLQALVGARTGEAALESALGTRLPAATGNLTNPTGANRPDGVAAPGTVPQGTIPPNTVAPLSSPGAPPTNSIPTSPASPTSPATPQGGR